MKSAGSTRACWPALARIEAAEAATLERWSERVLDARTLEEALAD